MEGVVNRRQATPKQSAGRSSTEGYRAEALVRPMSGAGKRVSHRRAETQERWRNPCPSAEAARGSHHLLPGPLHRRHPAVRHGVRDTRWSAWRGHLHGARKRALGPRGRAREPLGDRRCPPPRRVGSSVHGCRDGPQARGGPHGRHARRPGAVVASGTARRISIGEPARHLTRPPFGAARDGRAPGGRCPEHAPKYERRAG